VPVTRVLARNVSAHFGTATQSFVTVADGFGFFVIQGGTAATHGIAGRLTGSVTVSVPGVQIQGNFTLAISNIASPVDASVAFGPQATGTTAVALGDVNGDHKADLVVGTSGNGTLLYLNDGDGSPFDTLPAIHIDTATTAADVTTSLALGDLDGNGSLDLVVGNTVTNRIYLNDGSGVFTLDSHSVGTKATAVAIGDVNGDGRADVVIGHDGTAASVLELYTSGALSSTTTGGVTTTTWAGFTGSAATLGETSIHITSLAFADLDKNGKPDLVVGTTGGAKNRYYVNTGTALDTGHDLGSETDNTVALAVGDLDGDGYVDVVAINQGQSRAYRNLSVGTSVALSTAATVGDSLTAATSGALVDANGDGALDLVIGVDGSANRLYANNGTTFRTGGDGHVTSTSTAFTAASGSFVAADANKVIEIGGTRFVVSSVSAGAVTLGTAATATSTSAPWRLYTWGGFGTTATSLDSATSTKSLAVGDLNGDGKQDLVAGNGGAGQPNALFLGTGTAFTAPIGIGSVSLHLDTGPFLRVEGTGVQVSILGQTLSGDFTFQQTGVGSARVTTIDVSNGKLQLEGLAPLDVSGSLLIANGGIAGRFSLSTTSLTIGPVTLGGTLRLLINTTGAAAVLPDGASTVRVDAGPYLRIEGIGITVDLDGTQLAGDFAIEQTTNNLGQHRTTIAVANVHVTLPSSTGDILSDGQGVLLLLSDGIAGQLSGSINAAGLLPSSVGLVGTFGIAINKTGHAVDESVTVGGRTIAISLPAGPFLRISGTGAQLSVLGQTLSGNFSVEKTATATTVTASNVSLRIGNATTDFVTLTNGQGTFTVAGVGITGTLSGTVAVNVPGISLSGTLQVAIDTSAADPANRYLRVRGTNLSLAVLGQTLKGDFSFEQSGTGPGRVVTLGASNVALFLGDDKGTTATGDDIGLRLTGGAGQLTITSGGVYGQIGGTVDVQLPGFAATLPINIRLNTTSAVAATIPAASLRIETTSTAHLTILGQDISGNFSFEQVRNAGVDGVLNTADDTKVIRIAASGVAVTLGTGGSGVQISDGTATLLVTTDGLAGEISANATVTLGSTVVGPVQVSVSINNMAHLTGTKLVPVAVNEQFVVGGATKTLSLPAGPYVRVAVTGLSITIAGQQFAGDFSFERITTSLGADGALGGTGGDADTTVTRVSLANVVLRLGSATRDFVLVSNGHGQFDLEAGGIHGSIAADIAVDIPNVAVGGTFTLELDTRPATASLTVKASNAFVTVLGQRLTADSFVFTRNVALNSVSVSVTNGKLAFGNGTTTFVLVTLDAGSIQITNSGVSGSLTGSVTTPVFATADFSLDLPVAVQFNTAKVGAVQPFLRVQAGLLGGPLAQLNVFGQQLSGVFSFEQLTTAAGAKVVHIGLQQVGLFVGAGSVGVTISAGSGSLLITPLGIAGKLTATATANVPSISISGTIDVEFNRLSTPVHETFTFVRADGTTVTAPLDLNDAGPYVRVASRGIDVTIGSATVHGDFFIERGTVDRVDTTEIGVANLSYNGIGNARGALVVLPKVGAPTQFGIAGVALGSATGSAGGFTAGATLGLGINTTGGPVNKTVTVNGTAININLSGDGVFLIAQDVTFNFQNLLEIRGNFQISSTGSFSADGIEIFVGKGPSKINGVANPDAIGLLLSGASVSFQRIGSDNSAGQYVLYATGTLALVGLDGLQVTGHATLMINTTDTTKSITPPGGSAVNLAGGVFDVTGDIHFAVPGVLDVGGTIHVARQPNGALDLRIDNASVAVTVSGTHVFSINGSAAFTIGGAGGFHLSSFKVNGFSIFGQSLGSATGAPPILFPTASVALDALSLGLTPDDLGAIGGKDADKLAGNVLGPTALGVLNTRHWVDVVYTDKNGSGLKDSSILDATPEFEFLIDGAAAPGITINGAPTKVAGKLNTYRYTFTGNLPSTGSHVFSTHFLSGSFSDNSGSSATGVNNSDTSQQVFTVPTNDAKPGPSASLASPGSGDSVTAQSLNAKRYLDITFESHDGSAIVKSSIETGPAPFKLSGPGIADLAVAANGVPVILGSPLLLRGTENDAKSVTYRFFLKDKDTTNAVEVFQPGTVTVTFAAGGFSAATSSAGTSQTFTVDPNAPGAATGNGTVNLGPLSLQGPSIAIADIGFDKGMLVLTIAIGLDRAGLNFGGSTTTATQSSAQQSSGVSLNLTGILGTFDLSVDALGILGGHFSAKLPGKFSLRVASLEGHVPDVVDISASGILVQYDPAGAPDQELVRIDSASITFPKLNVKGTIRPFDTNAGHNVDSSNGAGIIPGLVVRQNGFTLGTAELQYGGVTPAGGNQLTATSGDGKIRLGNIIEFDDIRIGVQNFSVNFDAENPVVFNGSIYVASGGAKFFPGKSYNATITDRKTADDKNPDGTDNTEAFRLQLTFSNGRVDSFQAKIDTLELNLGGYVTITARDFMLNTGAADNEELVSFQSVGAHVKVGPLDITGEARNFAFLGDGTFKTKPGFGVFLSVGSATGDSFQIPSILGVRIDAIGIEWADLQNHPEDFVLTVSASVTGIKGLGNLEFSGAVQGLRIQPSLLAQGKFPIISIDSLAVGVKGDLFGGQIDAQLLGGILKLDSNYQIIGTFDTTTPVFKRVFYLGLQGGYSMLGMGGFTIRLGLSELGPLSVFINVKTPTGVIIVPQIGLTLNDFSAGVEFFKTLPSIDDPMALRNPEFGLPTDQTADQWLAGLQQQVALQAQAIAASGGGNGFFAAFTAPMTITGSARVYSIYTSQDVFNGQVIVKISTDGKILIIGKLNFAQDHVSISGRLYADLSKVANGDVTVLFLADIPDQVRLLTIYGKLKMGFRDSTGSQVQFDVVQPAAAPTNAKPTVQIVDPVSDGGSIDVSKLGSQHTIDVVYTAPGGANLDYTSIFDDQAGDPNGGQEFTITESGVTFTVTARPKPIALVSTAGGIVGYELKVQDVLVNGVTVRGVVRADASDVVLTATDLAGSPSDADLLAAAIRKTGTNRFRYDLGSPAWKLGTVTVAFAADSFKNADVTSGGNIVTGATNAASTFTFTVEGATARLVDPGAGGTVDVNLINDRSWMDVLFSPPASPTGLTINDASIMDLAPEFTLGGAGLGSIVLDPTRAPVRIPTTATGVPAGTLTYRYWLTGKVAPTGPVTLTYLPNTWSYGLATAPTVAPVTITLVGPTFLTVVFPDPGLNFALDESSIIDSGMGTGAQEIQIAIWDPTGGTGSGALATVFGTSATAFGWTISLVTSTAPTKLSALVYRFEITIAVASPSRTSVVVQQQFVDQSWSKVDTTTPGATPVAVTVQAADNDATAKASLRQILSTNGDLPQTIRLTIPGTYSDGTSAPSLTLDPATVTNGAFVDADTNTPGIQLAVSGGTSAWTVTLDDSRAPVEVGSTNQYDIPVIVTLGTSTLLDVTVSPTLKDGAPGVGYAGATTGGTQGGQAQTVSELTAASNDRTFIDIAFSASAGHLLDAGTIGGNEFLLGGFGGSSVTAGGSKFEVVPVGDNVFRFMAHGDFRPGTVEVQFQQNTWDENPARGPPGTGFNAAFTRTFSVVGTTADLVRTIPANGDTPETVVALGGSTVGKDVINGLGYLEVSFRPTSGNTLDASTVNGDELQLRDVAGNLVQLSTTPLRVGATTTYRYGFTGQLGAGTYTATFVAGSFADSSGVANQTETESFSVVVATADLADPHGSQQLDTGTINGRGWIDVAYDTNGGQSVNADTITDAGQEFALVSSGETIVVDGAAVLIAATGKYRYFFTGHKSGNTLGITFIAQSWEDVTGTKVTDTTTAHADLPAAGGQTYVDVTLTPTTGAQVDLTTVDGNEITLSGAGLGTVVPVATNGVTRLGDTNTFRYAFTGAFAPGNVTVSFNAGSWSDTAGNAGLASSNQFSVIKQAQSFFIELSGGLILQAPFVDEPLVDLKADITLEIDSNRNVFTLTFSGQLKLIKLGTVGATAGRFVLDMSNQLANGPQLWGVATLETNFSALEPYGIFLFGKGTLQINTTHQTHVETLTLKGLGNGGTDLTRTFTLRPQSFSVELVGQLRVRPPGTTTDLVRLQGGFFLSIDPAKFQIYATAELSFGVGDAQLTYGQATGLIIVRTGTDGANPGVAGMLTVGSSAGIGLPNLGNLFSVSGSVTVMFNTTRQDQVFQIPDDFLPLLHPGDPTTITIYASSPGLDGQRNPAAPPGGEIYVSATIQAQITIGGVLTLNGFIQIQAGVAPGTGNAFLRVVGAVGTQIAFLGSLSGQLNLTVFLGANPGVVGRVYLTLDSSAIPGVELGGQFLLEINTYSTDQPIQTFKTKTAVRNGRTTFDGFERNAAGNLVVANDTITTHGGFKLLMAGHLIVGSTLDIEAEVQFRLELSGANAGIELIVNGSMSLGPMGQIALVDSGFRINSQGLVARVQLAIDANFGKAIGLKFDVSGLLSLNTTGQTQTLGSSTVDAGFRLRIEGDVDFLGFAKGSGFVDITIAPDGFQLLFGLSFELGGLTFAANGGAAVVGGDHPGFALKLNVRATADADIFLIDASGTLQINTSDRDLIGVAAKSFLLDLNGKVEILKVLKFDAGLRVVVQGGEWSFNAHADVNFFGIIKLSGSVFLDSKGNFDVRLSGGMTLGSSSFGLSGTFHFRIASIATVDPTNGNPYYVFDLSGGARVEARVFGITLAGLGLDFAFHAEGSGRTKIELSVRVTIDLGLFSISKTARFTIGYLELPKPVYLAGNLGSPTTWQVAGGELYLNVGSRAGSRNLATDEHSESYVIDQLTGGAGGGSIKVTGFGRSNIFPMVTAIHGDFGDGNDQVQILKSVKIPVFLDGGAGEDVILYAGDNGATVLNGGAGSDYVEASGPSAVAINGGDEDNTGVTDPAQREGDTLVHSGTGTATIHGGNGDDRIFGNTATDALYGDGGNDTITGPAATIDGGSGDDSISLVYDTTPWTLLTGGTGTNDTLTLYLRPQSDAVTVSKLGAGSLQLGINGVNSTVTGFENLELDGRGGADAFTVNDLEGAGLSTFTIDLGHTFTVNGTKTVPLTVDGKTFNRVVPDVTESPDNAADSVTIYGSDAADDKFVLTASGADAASGRYSQLAVARSKLTRDAVTHAVTATTGLYSITITQSVRSEGDALTVDAGAGDDILDASGLGLASSQQGIAQTNQIAVTLIGGTGDDRLIGTPFDDVLDSGDGNDTVTGGEGLDTFIDSGGNDTLIETFDRDIGLFDNALVVGQILGDGKAQVVTMTDGVSAGPEVQRIQHQATGGTFRLKYGSTTSTVDLSYKATQAEVLSALNGISAHVASVDATIRTAGSGVNTATTYAWTITFDDNVDRPIIEAVSSLTAPPGVSTDLVINTTREAVPNSQAVAEVQGSRTAAPAAPSRSTSTRRRRRVRSSRTTSARPLSRRRSSTRSACTSRSSSGRTMR